MGPTRKRKASPTEIPGDAFKKKADLATEILQDLVVDSPADTASLISDWSRGIGCGLAVSLNNDNSKIVSCTPVLMGDLFLPSSSGIRKTFAVNGCWPAFPTLSLAFSPLDGAIFTFNNSMVSELVDSGAVEYDLIANNEILTDEACDKGNIKGFTLRLYLVPSTHDYVKLTLTICPLPLAELTAVHPLATNPKFPQIRLWGGMVPFLPAARSILAADWGCPFLPSLIPGGPVSDVFPSSSMLRSAISSTLRSAVRPEIKANSSTLFPRWAALQEHGAASLDSTLPDMIWPDTEAVISLPSGS